MGTTSPVSAERISTGVPGLDEILHGGLFAHQLYLVDGPPGSGKTTFGLQFLLEGVRTGEKTLYVTLTETPAELATAAASHGWKLDGIEVFEFSSEVPAGGRSDYTLFYPSEVELTERLTAVLRTFDSLQPTRVVIDSLSELRLLARDTLRFRRQILTLKNFFCRRNATVIILDDMASDGGDRQMHSLTHGVIALNVVPLDYGSDRRRLKVTKLRGSTFSGGFHDMTITTGGVVMFPRLIAMEHPHSVDQECIPTGLAGMDDILGGGIHRGTSTLLIGAAGTGKSALATLFACAVADRGGFAAMFTFEESRATLSARSALLGLPLEKHIESGRIAVEYIDAAEMSAGEFVSRVRRRVQEDGARLVVLDSLNGFLHAIPGDRSLLLQLHELLAYLGRHSVATVLVEAQSGLVGAGLHSPLDTSYLVDAVVLTRFFEVRGEMRRALSVLKNRLAFQENTIRELSLGTSIQIGPPLREFEGVITGTPTWVGRDDSEKTE